MRYARLRIAHWGEMIKGKTGRDLEMGNVLERANKNYKKRWKLLEMGLENRESGKTERKGSDNSGQNGIWLQEKESSMTLWKHNSVFQKSNSTW